MALRSIQRYLQQGISGFTLVELLIALAILGELAAFTIPKVISAQQKGNYNAAAKEAAATISQAYQLYRLNNTPSSSTTFGDMTSYINYVKYDTTGTVDSKQNSTSLSCSVGCLLMPNGGVLRYNSVSFSGTATTNALGLIFDPNGTYGGTTDGPDKSVEFFLYYNGRLTTRGTCEVNTVADGGTVPGPNPSLDPPWFSWN